MQTLRYTNSRRPPQKFHAMGGENKTGKQKRGYHGAPEHTSTPQKNYVFHTDLHQR
jgi:hypothetical protein